MIAHKKSWQVGIAFVAAIVAVLTLASSAHATRFRRPFSQNLAVRYGFDTNGSAAGCRDYNCGTDCYDGHTGADFPLPMGTNVLAAAAGKVAATYNGCANTGSLGNTCGGRCGNYVMIDHADGNRSIYCHMQLNSLKVSTGQTVTCGQLLGLSASSGSSTGPHLHLGWRRSGVYSDPYRGSCTSSPGVWVQQNAYRQAVGTTCESTSPPPPPPPPPCVPTEEICDGKDNNCNGQIDEGEVCERDFLLRSPGSYAPATTTDMDGDGRSDACGRGSSGFWCMLAQGDGSFQKSGNAALSNAAGWSQVKHYSTIRMGDIDGDGRADVCARGPERVHCWKSTGSGFSAAIDGPAWADSVSWGNPQYYTTIRLLDIDGDGRDDICARAAAGMRCFLSNGNGFGTGVTGPEWSNAKGFDLPRYYGTLRTGDINGDGKDDLCIRTPDGIECFLSNGSSFPTRVQGPAWADSVGWGHIRHWSTIRMADINGDGRADICARGSAGSFCALSQGSSFAGSTLLIPELSNANGWDDPVRYETIRTGDIDGDGAEEICARAEDGVYCWRNNGSGMTKVSGPKWSDANGWRAHHHNSTLSLADVNGDGKADVCARAAAGWLCSLSTGSGFSGTVSVAEFTSSGGWTDGQYYTTLRSGGLCRGGASCAAAPDPGDPGDPGGDDAGTEPWADGGEEWEPDSGLVDNDGGPGGASPWPEAGSPIGNGDGLGDPAADDVMVDADSGCQCGMAGRRVSNAPFAFGSLALLGIYIRRSRRKRSSDRSLDEERSHG